MTSVKCFKVVMKDNVRIYPTGSVRRRIFNDLRYLNCEFGISMKDSAIVMGKDVFDSLKMYQS